jgi:hypothetical protein
MAPLWPGVGKEDVHTISASVRQALKYLEAVSVQDFGVVETVESDFLSRPLHPFPLPVDPEKIGSRESARHLHKKPPLVAPYVDLERPRTDPLPTRRQ